jgi:hypothetical protein
MGAAVRARVGEHTQATAADRAYCGGTKMSMLTDGYIALVSMKYKWQLNLRDGRSIQTNTHHLINCSCQTKTIPI